MRLFVFSLIAVAVYLLLFFPRWRNRGYRSILYSLFYVYVCAVIFLTLLPVRLVWAPESFNGDFGNFIPFHDLKMGYGGALKDILLNVLMMIPFGILLPSVKNRGCAVTVLSGFLSSAAIEGIQLVSTVFGSRYHAFDVTDIITNTVGALIGYLLYKFIKTVRNP